jgi:hypothetical protein
VNVCEASAWLDRRLAGVACWRMRYAAFAITLMFQRLYFSAILGPGVRLETELIDQIYESSFAGSLARRARRMNWQN